MSNSTKNQLVEHRLSQAVRTVDEIKVLIENELYSTAVNRIYYGLFYSVLALALWSDFKTSKHQQLIGWFNKNFVHTGKVSTKLGRIALEAFDARQENDYDAFVEYTKEDVLERYAEMKEFVEEVALLLKKEMHASE